MKIHKPTVYATLLLALGGAWFYLYKMNEAEVKAITAIWHSIEQTRAEETAKQVARASAMRKQIMMDLSACQDDANKAMNDFIAANQKPDRHKRGHFVVSQEVADKAVKMFADGNALCQRAYTEHIEKVASL